MFEVKDGFVIGSDMNDLIFMFQFLMVIFYK